MMAKKFAALSIVAVALVGMSGTALAGSYPYFVARNSMDDFVVAGTNPVLSPTAGNAQIDHVDDLGGGLLRVWVKCLSTSVDCVGTIETS